VTVIKNKKISNGVKNYPRPAGAKRLGKRSGNLFYRIFFWALIIAFFFATAIFIDVKHYRLKLLALETGVLVFMSCFLASTVIKGKFLWKRNVLDKWVLFYFVYVLARYAVFRDKNVARMEIEKNILCFGVYFVFSQFIAANDVKKIIKIYVASAVMIALYGLWQNFGTPVMWFRVPKISPPYATFGNQDFFAAYLVIAAPLLLVLLIGKSIFWKMFGAAGIIIFALDFYYINSRGGILSVFVSAVVFMITKYGARIKQMRIILLGVIIAASVAGYAKRSFWLRDTQRLLIWRDTAVMAFKNPFGVGPGAFASNFPSYASEALKNVYPQKKFIVNFAHNEYLEIFAELGAPGLILFFILVITFFRECRSPYFLAAAAGILTNNLFSVDMRFIISAAFLYIIFALYRSSSSKEIEIDLKGSLRAAPAVVAIGSVLFFTPKMLMPFRALAETSSEADFYEDVKRDEISELEKELSAKPRDYDILYKLGWLCAKKKDYRKAINYFMSASEVRPTAGLWNNIGNIFFETGGRENAINAYKNAISLNPDLVDSRFNLGYVYFYEGRLKEASECFREVLVRDKNNAKAIMMLGKMKE